MPDSKYDYHVANIDFLVVTAARHLLTGSTRPKAARPTVFQSFPIPKFWKTLLASLVGVLTLVGIMTRPFRWNEAVIAMAGAAVLLLLGLISPSDAFFTLIRDWNTFLFFLGMMGLSALAETAGLFDWLAVQAARFAGKRIL